MGPTPGGLHLHCHLAQVLDIAFGSLKVLIGPFYIIFSFYLVFSRSCIPNDPTHHYQKQMFGSSVGSVTHSAFGHAGGWTVAREGFRPPHMPGMGSGDAFAQGLR